MAGAQRLKNAAEIPTSADKQKCRLELQRSESIGIINMSGSSMDWNYRLGEISGVRFLKEIRGLVLDLQMLQSPLIGFLSILVWKLSFSGSIAT